MTNWKEYRLGEICTITSSKRIFYNEYVSFGIPFFRSKEIIEKAKGSDISTELFITESKYNDIKTKFGVPQKGDILLTSVGTLGVSYRVKKEDLFYFKDGNLTWFKDYIKDIDSKFLLYWLRSCYGKEAFNNITIGSTQSALTIQGLKGIKLLIPDILTQTSIAEILSTLDDKIILNTKINQNLNAVVQALFKLWFIDFDFMDENGFPYKSSGNEMVESELGEIPKGWKIGILDDLVTIKGGTTPSTTEPTYWDGDIYWTSPKDLSNLNGPVLLNTEKRITKEGLKKIGSGLLPKGTLLLSSRAPIGYLAITEIETAINQGYIAINSKSGCSNQYMLYWLKQNMDVIISHANGSTFLEISKSKFRQIKVVIPSLEIHNSFYEQASVIFEQLIVNQRESQQLTQLRDFLLPQLISGELKISDVQILEPV